MKTILIIASGILAKQFLQKVMNLKGSINQYIIVSSKKKYLPEGIENQFEVHCFDPTSFTKLGNILNRHSFYQAMIVINKKSDALSAYENIRQLDKNMLINILDRWDIDLIKDASLSLLKSQDIISSRFLDFLPGYPVTARNVGLAKGEIMQVRVPHGSSFLYRHLASIEQKNWKIVGIYRDEKLLIARPTLMIRPNDIILLLGDPDILNDVFRSVTSEKGQFPRPFGKNIYALVDMKNMQKKQIKELINNSIMIHSNINNQKLYIRVINPTYSDEFDLIKKQETPNILVHFEYHKNDLSQIIKDDKVMFDIGLIVVNNQTFKAQKTFLYESKLPILKTGIYGFASLKSGIILASQSTDIEKESSIVLDICSQLNLKTDIYQFNQSNEVEQNSVIEHFKHLSKIFSKEVNIIKLSEENPLLFLKDKSDFMQFVRFDTKLTKSGVFDVFATNLDKHSYLLENNYQLFIPTSNQKI